MGRNRKEEKKPIPPYDTCPWGSEQDRIDAYKCRVSSIHKKNAPLLSVDELILMGFHTSNLGYLKQVMSISYQLNRVVCDAISKYCSLDWMRTNTVGY